MYDRVIFYNHYGNGDIFESREFVKAWKKLIPAKEYFYAHGKNPRILMDIPEIKYMEVTSHMDSMRAVWDDLNGNLYVNTWIGRDGRYVLPGIGCTVEKLYLMHNDMLRSCGADSLPGTPKDYIPKIDYSYYILDKIVEFSSSTAGVEKVYIDNGLVQSSQAENFDFNPIIESIADMYKDRIFICTHYFNSNLPNVKFVRDFAPGVGFDLNEASFLSLHCNVLIGRNSGPHVFTQVFENVMNRDKKLLSFTYHILGSSFVVNTDVLITKYWSPATKANDIITKIQEVLG